jgi:hypothetical protein
MEDGAKRFTENIESLAARKRNDEPVLDWLKTAGPAT